MEDRTEKNGNERFLYERVDREEISKSSSRTSFDVLSLTFIKP